MKINNLPFFENSVRVFFPLAACLAILVPSYTVCVIVNGYLFPENVFNIYQWHGLEMLFGYTLTLMAGFILTAGAKWSGNIEARGTPLFMLLLLWLLERITFLVSDSFPLLLILSLLFPIYLLILIVKVMRSYTLKWVFLTLILLLPILRLLFLLSINNFIDLSLEIIYEITLWVLIMLTSIISNRIIPKFTYSYFKINEGEYHWSRLDKCALFATFLMLVGAFNFPSWLVAFITILAGALNLIKMFQWSFFKSLKIAKIGFFQLSHFIFAVAIIYKGLSISFPQLGLFKSNIHFIVLGAITLIAMNIMVRASLGHTGRKIEFTLMIKAIFAMLFLGMLIRVFIPIFYPAIFLKSLHWSMGFWTLGFILYLIKFLPILFKPRVTS